MSCISQIKVSILTLRVCLDFISSLVENYFRGDLVSLIAAIVVYLQEQRGQRYRKESQINGKADSKINKR